MRGRGPLLCILIERVFPPPLTLRRLPVDLRANLKSINLPARLRLRETLGTYVFTNYAVHGVINVLLN